MDQEIVTLLKAVTDGQIREPDQVRKILAESSKELADLRNLYAEAEDAFLSGWGLVESKYL